MTANNNTDYFSKYVDCMEEIKQRSYTIKHILTKDKTTGYKYTDTEFICLQFRKMLELIALANLVSNKEEYAKKHTNFANHYHAKHIIRDIEKINPHFYPRPTKQVTDQITRKVVATEDIKKGYLTKEEFAIVYDECSQLMHAENPFAKPKDLDRLYNKFNSWLSKINTLHHHHHVQLIDPNLQIWCHMNDSVGKVDAWIFEKVYTPSDKAKIEILKGKTLAIQNRATLITLISQIWKKNENLTSLLGF